MIEHNKSLKAFNTFGFDQRAEHYALARNENELEELVDLAATNQWPVFILGGGSNIVLTQDIPGLVIHMADTSIQVIDEDDFGNKRVRAGAGVVWHDFVLRTLEMGAHGLENLSLIPGFVGAAPVQNIGAYGVEVKDRIHKVRALHMPSREWREFTAAECNFSYRHSYFKDHPGKYAITHVEFDLGEKWHVETDYASLKMELETRGLSEPSHNDVCEAVTRIRQSRLPDPHMIGNAGSFFHNPVVSEAQVMMLETQFPGIVSFPAQAGFRKLSAAWMIDYAGFKGEKRGPVGVYERQALVLVHSGNGNGTALLKLASEIQGTVFERFSVKLNIEPMVV